MRLIGMCYDDVIHALIPEVEHHQNRFSRGLGATVTPGCRWLDIGSGTRLHHGWIGESPEALASRAGFLVGCDLVQDHLRSNAELHAAVIADAVKLPFAPGSFDIVTANMVLEHLPDPVAAFREIARVLVRGGKFVFVTPNRRNPVVAIAAALLTRQSRRRLATIVESRGLEHVFPTFYAANSVRDLNVLATATGFDCETLETFNSYPFCRVGGILTAIECTWIRFVSQPSRRHLTSNLLGVLTRL